MGQGDPGGEHQGGVSSEFSFGSASARQAVRCTSAYHPIAADWLQLKLK
jgi:hypothetical protein